MDHKEACRSALRELVQEATGRPYHGECEENIGRLTNLLWLQFDDLQSRVHQLEGLVKNNT